jgi:type II secretory pathway component GspD/PulD (secretin)/beta-lactamase regulating signal transducer with metallopeptidase domain
MNTLIEALNAWADHALRFAWPMLWQSSLLIAFLFVLELLLKRKVRSAVRYALWLVVLVKLLLPPSLAFPTSAGWWLRPAIAAPASLRPTSVTVTYGTPERPQLPTAVMPVLVEPPHPHLSSAAWLLVGMIAVSIALLAWMLARWHQVAQRARRAAAAPSWLNELLHGNSPTCSQAARKLAGGECGEAFGVRGMPPLCSANQSPKRGHTPHSKRFAQFGCGYAVLRPSRLGGSDRHSSTAWLRVRLTDHPQSPAVCGLFRPVILLPRSLAERLPPAQLRAVLLHELLHLRRGDVWVNCAQALLQIAYWWHPLLWLANARIRRLREEAVDDGVMLALSEDAETYAPTLLEVAKLALHRPLASLGLVGILESRNALRQRIERLMNFRPPGKAGLTLTSVLGILGFAALAVPMGQAPAPGVHPEVVAEQALASGLMPEAAPSAASPVERPPFYVRTFRIDPDILMGRLLLANGGAQTNGLPAIVPALLDYLARMGVDLDPVRNPGKALYYHDGHTTSRGMLTIRATQQDLDIIERQIAVLKGETGQASAPAEVPQASGSDALTKIKASTLVQDGKLLYEMGKLDEAEGKLKLAMENDPHDEAALYYLNLVSVAKFDGAANLHQRPEEAAVNEAVYRQANRITLRQRLADARGAQDRHALASAAKLYDDAWELVLRIGSGVDAERYQTIAGLTAVRMELARAAQARGDYKEARTQVDDVLRVDPTSAVAIEFVFSTKPAQESPPLHVRTFKVDPNTLLEGLHLSKRQVETSSRDVATRALRDCFARAGVDLDPYRNPAKAVFFNDRQGMVVVRATLQDLDIIEALIPMLNYAPPQINIKAKFVEVPEEETKALGFDWYLGNVLMSNSPTGGQIGIPQSPGTPPKAANPMGIFPGALPAGTNDQPLTSGIRPLPAGILPPAMTGILTQPQYQVVLKALEQRAGTDVVAQPEVTVLSGRQAQCKVVEVRTIVNGIDPRALTPPGITRTNDAVGSALATESMEFGPTLDVTPSVLPDGFTINLPLTASLLEFLGYEDNPTNLVTVYVNGKQKQISPPRPVVRTAQISSQANVWDGQTLVLGGLVSERVVTTKDSVPVLGDLPLVGRLFRSESRNTQKRRLLVFITPTIIDPAGNRVHSDEEMPFTRQAIPQQPPR